MASADEREYFTFSAVRNPLDIAVTRYVRLKDDVQGLYRDPTKVAVRNSLASRIERRIYAWVQRTDADFERFLRRWYLLPYDTWTTLDHDSMDAVIRFESLTADFDATLERIGITRVRALPVRNATPGRDRDWERHYTPGAIRRAIWVFGPYMERWGYAFPESWGAVRVPWWSRVLYRVAHLARSVYWKHFRFADYVKRRPGGVKAIPRGRAGARGTRARRLVRHRRGDASPPTPEMTCHSDRRETPNERAGRVIEGLVARSYLPA